MLAIDTPMARVHLPSGWAAATGGLSEVDIDAPRVRELLLALAGRFPDLAPQLDTVAVAVDGQIYHDAEFVELPRGAEIHLVPRISGG